MTFPVGIFPGAPVPVPFGPAGVGPYACSSPPLRLPGFSLGVGVLSFSLLMLSFTSPSANDIVMSNYFSLSPPSPRRSIR